MRVSQKTWFIEKQLHLQVKNTQIPSSQTQGTIKTQKTKDKTIT